MILTAAGADLDYEGGQPVMDRGVQNQALLSLFTRKGWCGNAYLSAKEQLGSDFEKTCSKAVTLKSITTDIPDAAGVALKADVFGTIDVSVSNPRSDQLEISIGISAPQDIALVLKRSSQGWSAT